MGIAGFGLRLMTVALAVMVAGCSAERTVGGSGVHWSAPDDPAPSTSQQTEPAPQPSLAAAMREWEVVAGDHFKQSARALEEISAAAGVGDDSAVRAGCTDLHDTNVAGLQGHLPTPDPALTAELQRMIDDVNTATHACLRFVDGRDLSEAVTYQEYLGRAVEHLQRAKGILAADLRGR